MQWKSNTKYYYRGYRVKELDAVHIQINVCYIQSTICVITLTARRGRHKFTECLRFSMFNHL